MLYVLKLQERARQKEIAPTKISSLKQRPSLKSQKVGETANELYKAQSRLRICILFTGLLTHLLRDIWNGVTLNIFWKVLLVTWGYQIYNIMKVIAPSPLYPNQNLIQSSLECGVSLKDIEMLLMSTIQSVKVILFIHYTWN